MQHDEEYRKENSHPLERTLARRQLVALEKYRNDEVLTLLLCVYCLMYMFSHFIEQISDYTEMASQEVRQQFGAFFFVGRNHFRWECFKNNIKRSFTRF